MTSRHLAERLKQKLPVKSRMTAGVEDRTSTRFSHALLQLEDGCILQGLSHYHARRPVTRSCFKTEFCH